MGIITVMVEVAVPQKSNVKMLTPTTEDEFPSVCFLSCFVVALPFVEEQNCGKYRH
jgi:hypothetical protein